MGEAMRRSQAPVITGPYEDNVLINTLGPIRTRQQWMESLLDLPPVPRDVAHVPRHQRLHHLMIIRDLHLPTLEELRLAETIDLAMRQSYRYRDPVLPETWAAISGEEERYRPKRPEAPPLAVAVNAVSGVGKSEAIKRILASYPRQIAPHSTFPRLVGGLRQMVWQSVDVPATGKSADMAEILMLHWDAAMPGDKFAATLSGTRRRGAQMLSEWVQAAKVHFLGALHLDEVQNFFRLMSLDERRRLAKAGTYDLRVVEDGCLKWMLQLTNTSGFPVILSGTGDGIEALMKRMSTGQRLCTLGCHELVPFAGASDPGFRKHLLGCLEKYQYVANPITVDDNLAKLIYEKTAGVHRLIIALWIAAHRVALERPKVDALTIEDFTKAADTYLALVKRAVEALLSGDPQRLGRYEDLLPRDAVVWARFWGAMRQAP